MFLPRLSLFPARRREQRWLLGSERTGTLSEWPLTKGLSWDQVSVVRVWQRSAVLGHSWVAQAFPAVPGGSWRSPEDSMLVAFCKPEAGRTVSHTGPFLGPFRVGMRTLVIS